MKRFTPRTIYFDQLGQITFTIREVAKLLWKINPRLTLLIFALSAFWGLLTFPTFYLEKLILDQITTHIGSSVIKETLYTISLLVTARIIIEVVRNFVSNNLGYLRTYASRNFHIDIELMMADKLSKLDVMTLEEPLFQDRFNKLEREAGRRAWGLMMPLTDIPNYVAGFFSSVVVLWFVHPLVALGVVLVSLPTILVDRKYIKRWYDFELEMAPYHRVRGHISHYLIRTQNYLESRILHLREYLVSKMKEVHGKIMKSEMEIHKRQEQAHTFVYIPSAVFYAAINVYLASLALSTKISIGSYELFLRSLLSASQNFTSLTNAFLEIFENYVFVADLVWFLNLESRISEEGGQDLGTIKKGIEMKDVWFKYSEDGQWILKGANVLFNYGEKIAIVGENGAGKSTLIKVLTRFYDASKGEVLVDGVNIREINYPQYQSKFAVLFQNFEDYSFSARESIGYGDVDRLDDTEGIKKAAQKTGMHEYLEGLPLKYETPLSPHFHKGVQLSGGQWQRIGLARVLFREKAEILILDEPTSNVDPEAEEKIFDELMKISKSKILIFVSQRFSTVRHADKILVVDRGKILEQGSHKELMKKNGKYARLFKLQAQGYK